MRLIWSSNSPFCPTGYGMTSAAVVKGIKKLGHDIAFFAFFGLEGAKVDWGDIPIYPNNPRDWGIKDCWDFYQHWKADALITLVDIWVLGGMDQRMNWFPYMPVDHDPLPPRCEAVIKQSPHILKIITQSQHGVKRLAEKGIDSWYCPPPTNCQIFQPDAASRKVYREQYKWEDKFVIMTVATNHAERKNYNAMLRGVSMFEKKHPGEVIFYMHTNPFDERGIDLNGLRMALGMEGYTFFPNQVEVKVGIDQPTLARAYNIGDVFLLPSKGEGFGVPIVEAQACGLPVITTKCTAQEELMGGGWFIEDLQAEWTQQSALQYTCRYDEVAERLEQAYQAKKDGSIVKQQQAARAKALDFDEPVIMSKYWVPILAEMAELVKKPRNWEGVQDWRKMYIPKTCAPRKVLDAGCGLTAPYKKLLEHLGEYVGVDIRANGSAPEDIIKADCAELPFKNKEFGFVWCSEMLEHTDNPKKVVDELKRVGVHGVILFSTPETPSFKGDPDHKIVTDVKYTTVATGDGMITW